MQPNQQKSIKLLSAVIAASALLIAGTFAVALSEERSGTATASTGVGARTAGQTTTKTPAATVPGAFVAPTIKAHRPRGY